MPLPGRKLLPISDVPILLNIVRGMGYHSGGRRPEKEAGWRTSGVEEGGATRQSSTATPAASLAGGGEVSSHGVDDPWIPSTMKDDDSEDRKGFKYDEKLDLGTMLNNYMPIQVVNENRVRPRKFVKMGRNTVEEPGGEAEPPGSPNPSPETIDMGRKILEFFKSRDPVPLPTMTRFKPGKREQPPEPREPTSPAVLAQLAAAAKQRPLPVAQHSHSEPAEHHSGRSKLQLLSKLEKKAVSKRAPPPRADIRQNFRPQPPRQPSHVARHSS